LLILGDKGDPVAPKAACLHFAKGVKDSTVIMVYNEGRHHPIGGDALKKYAVPFLQNKPLTMKDRIQKLLSSAREFLGQSLFGRLRALS
jgi:hypothetical protein